MFRRRKSATGDEEPAGESLEESLDAGSADPRARGPWDSSEVDLEAEPDSRVDLGSLLIRPVEGLEVQLQVDEASGQVAAVVVVGPEGAAELRAFAAPRNGDIWDDVRRAIAGEVAQMGGTASEGEGPFGPELLVSLSVELEDGQHATQPSRVLGIRGPRWLLRATLFGRPAVEPDAQGDIERALRDVVVVRGTEPVPPGDALPLTVPPQVRPAAADGDV